MKESIVLTGGGTAGHIMPNIALLPYLKKEFKKIYYLGSSNSMEEKILKSYPEITFISIPTTKLIRKFTIKNLAIPFKLIFGINKTKKILKQINPNVIFCKGGFVSVPVAIAGKKCKIPVISHESDLSMGLANKIILKYAKAVCVSFKTTANVSKKCIYTGSPLRNQIFNGNKNNLKELTKNFNPQKPTLLFFGGSLGSKNINTFVEQNVEKLLNMYNIIHIIGKNNKNNINKHGYVSMPFVDNIEDYFDIADIVITRGGANSLFELLALNKLMLIIPLSKTQSRGDQIENANYFKHNGYGEVIEENELTISKFLNTLSKLKNSYHYLENMQLANLKSANEQITKIIIKHSK